MTTERSSFNDPGTDVSADEPLGAAGMPGTADALVGTRESDMASTGLSDSPPAVGSDYEWDRGSLTTGSGSADGGGDRLQQATSDVVDRVAGTAQQQVGTTVNSQLGRGADMLDQVSQAIRQTGDQLRQDQPQIAGIVDTTAQQVDRASQFLRQTDFQGLVRGTEDFARRQPAVFLGGALALGLVASRFLKASPSTEGTRNQGAGHGRI